MPEKTIRQLSPAGMAAARQNMRNYVGEKFGKLLVTARADSHRRPNGNLVTRVYAKCDCGTESIYRAYNLVSGHTASCGCSRNEERHGDTIDRKNSTEYNSHHSMILRCYNPRSESYRYYGGRGITVCERWRTSYVLFLQDMGRKPTPQHSLDRINFNGNYEPGNCRWATVDEQNKNKRKRQPRSEATA